MLETIEYLEETHMIEELERTYSDKEAVYYEGISDNGTEVELKVITLQGDERDGEVYGRPLLSDKWRLLSVMDADYIPDNFHQAQMAMCKLAQENIRKEASWIIG